MTLRCYAALGLQRRGIKHIEGYSRTDMRSEEHPVNGMHNGSKSLSNGADPNSSTRTNGVNGHSGSKQFSHSTMTSVPVLIVGGGPSGLLQAYLLSRFGIRSLVIEKYPARLAAPKAHALCPRSLEICRQFGLDTQAMRRLGSPRKDAFWVNFVTNLSGERIGRLPYERMDPAVLNDTPEMIHNIPQPGFEQFVANRLAEDANVEIRKGAGFVSCEQNENEVISTVEERATGKQYRIHSRHVIACDGAKSQVRKALQVDSEGEDSYETMMTIHFNADLRPVVKDRVGMLHWITDPACSGFIIAYDLGGNQVLISNFDSKRHPIGSWNEDLCRRIITAAIGRTDVDFKILSYRPWILSRKVAKQYHVGNVFLAGDAAHSFPPTGGLGLNSGIGDVHNLAYKIAAVHHGWASSSLLDSYVADRRQIALINAAQSVKNGRTIFSFLKTLGIAGIDDVDEARENLYRSIHDPAKQKMIDEEVEGQREHFDNVRTMSSHLDSTDHCQLEIHIGYVYGSTIKPAHASHYTPKFVAGARLPHAWIRPRGDRLTQDLAPIDVSYVKEWEDADVKARQWSTLDLCPFDGFTITTGVRGQWPETVEKVNAMLSKFKGLRVKLACEEDDFEFVFSEQQQLFHEAGGFASGRGLLVRPDQHILAAVDPQATADDIVLVIRRHLGL